MGIQMSIDIDFAWEYRPTDIVNKLIKSGWDPNFEGAVCFLPPEDKETYDWKSVCCDDFDLNTFLGFHGDTSKIGLVLVNETRGGAFLICSRKMSILLSINRLYLPINPKILDFSWYLERLAPFLSQIDVVCLNCELVN